MAKKMKEWYSVARMKILQNRYVLSSITTFLSMFLVTLGAQVASSSPIEWTATFWFSILVVAVRAAAKAVVESFARKTADL